MPDFADFSTDDSDDGIGNFAMASRESVSTAAKAVQPGNYSWATTFAGDAALGVLDLVDTVASSVPGLSRAAGIQRGQINESMLRTVDMPGLTKFYNENQGGIQVASGIYGILAAELVGRKVAAVATPFLAGVKTLPFAKNLLTLDTQYAKAMQTVRSVDASLASKGLTGASSWVMPQTVRTGVVSEAGPAMGLFQTLSRKRAANTAFAFGAAKGVKDAARAELVAATFLNQNQFLYSEDQGQNLMWMGLGVGAGGTFGALGAGYAMRKFANSDSMRRIAAQALDPSGQEAARLEVATLDPTQSKKTFLGNLNGHFTDKVTSLMVSAKSKIGEGVDSNAFNRLQIQQEALAMDELTKVTSKGINRLQGTAFDGKAAGYWNHVAGAAHKDPGVFYGAEKVGGVADESTIMGTHQLNVDAVINRLAQIDTMLAEAAAGTKKMSGKQRVALMTERKNLKFDENLVPHVLIDQELMPLSHGSVYDNYVEPTIRVDDSAGAKLFEAFDKEGKSLKVGIEANGTLYLPTVKGVAGTLDNIDHFDMLRLYRTSQHLISDMAKQVGDPAFKFEIPFTMGKNGKPEYSWFHLDMAEELLSRTNGRAQVDFGVLTRETAQKESLIQKIEALRSKDLGGMAEEEIQKLRLRYNLPRMTAYEMGVLGTSNGPLDSLVRGAASIPVDTLRNMSLNELKQTAAEFMNVGEMTARSAEDIKSLSGNSFRFMLDDAGNPIKPVLVYKRQIAPNDWMPDRIAERIAAKKINTALMLTGPESAPIVRNLAGGILSSPDYALGSQVAGLADSQIAGSIPGLANVAPNTATGSLLNAVVTAENRARDNPVILAVTRLRRTVDEQVRGFMRVGVEAAFGDSLTVLRGPRNVGSKTLLDNFHTFRSGWNLEDNTIRVPGQNGDVNAFVLAETQANKARWRTQFGTEMPKGQTLVDARGKEVVLDDLALDIQKRFNTLTDAQRMEKNSLLASQGLPEIRRTEWYVPPPDLQGKYIGFVQGADNQLIPNSAIIANTQEAFDRQVASMKADPKSLYNTVPGAQFRVRDEIQDFATIWDRAQMEMLNPGTTAIQGGKESKGILTGGYTTVNAFDSALRSVRDSYLNLGNDIVNVMLDDQIKAAKMRSHTAGGVTRNADAKQVQYRSIHDYWLEAATGRNPIANNGSAVGWLYNGLENRFNDLLRDNVPKVADTWAAATDWLTKRMPFNDSAQSVKQFDRLSAALGHHMPYESAAELMERKGAGINPWTAGDITGAGNRFAANWMLRMLEVAAPVMNLAGVLNAAPSVIRHISAKPGESAAELAARVGHSAHIFTAPDGRVFSALDMGKLAWKGFKRAWNKTSDAEYAYMSSNGFLTQEVAEFQRQFNAIEGGGKFKEGIKNVMDRASILTDKSEDFSRSWGHMIGLEAAEMMGITNKVAKHNFAHDIANKMIANYSPLNRPEIFQGAVGAPIGLFQSFMWAYYQRMFRYAETGDFASLGIQYAVQSSLFGVKSTPGFAELNNLFFENSDGQTSPYDAMYAKFGQSGGDMLMAGSLSNLPKLFGLPGTSLFTRGDVQSRVFTQNPLTENAAVNTASKVASGIGQAMALFSDANPDLSTQQVGEVLSNMIPNRPMAGFIEQTMAGGYDTDGAGQVVTRTKTLAESVYRTLGLRTIDQAKDVEAFYANKQAQEISAAAQDQFRLNIRSAIRNGDMDAIPAFVEKYIEMGNDPRQVKRMLRSAFDSALNSRSERQLQDVLKNPNKMYMVDRLMNAQVGIGDDEATEDPTLALNPNDPMDNPEMPLATEDSQGFSYGLPAQ